MAPIVLETIFLKTQYLVLNDSSILNYIITGNVHIANKNKNCELQSQLFYIKIVLKVHD